MINEAILNILKFSIFLLLVYLFYRLFLRRLTFYNWNRYYLLGYSLLAFVIPFINISPLLKETDLNQAPMIQYVPVMDPYVHVWTTVTTSASARSSHSFYWQNVMFWTLLFGSLIMLFRLGIQVISFFKMKRKAVKLNDDVVSIYQVESPIIPFSFGNAIYLNQKLHTEEELADIVLHEYAHIRQKHTIDILLAEAICIINWFNPFAWMLRHSIRQNLEFIADNLVLQKGTDKKIYQYHLLKATGVPQYRIFNSFNFSSLKKRIGMMNKIKSARIHLVKFSFLIPMLVVVLLAFRNKTKNTLPGQSPVYHLAGLITDARTGQLLGGVSVTETRSGITTKTGANGFYKFDVSVQQNNSGLHLQLKKEKYFLQGYDISVSANISGYINVFGLFDSTETVPKGKAYIFMDGAEPFNGDPEYADVLKEYRRISRANEQNNEFFNFISTHPNVVLFYTSERRRQIVFLKDGSYERYGYPGEPTIADMEKKYGSLPETMRDDYDVHAPSPEYLSHWEKISEEAEKEFHTSNSDVLHIIFPGDSRVIVVPKSGRPRIYDMDNAAPEERPAFEKLYGPLPAIVPPPSFNSRSMKATSSASDHISGKESSASDTLIKPAPLIKSYPDPSKKILVILDGKEMPAGISLDNIVAPDSIESVTILKDSAVSIYGEKAKDGAIIIKTKNYHQIKSGKPAASHTFFWKKNWPNRIPAEEVIATQRC